MNAETPRVREKNDIQDPKYTLEKYFKPFFLKDQPFLHDSVESEETLKSAYIAFNREMSSSITKLATLNPKQNVEQITERLNYLASLTMKKTAKTLGYESSEKIEISKIDLLTLDATLGMLSKFIEDSVAKGQNLQEIEASLNSFLNENIAEEQRNENIDAIISEQATLTIPQFCGARNQLFLSTLSESKIATLTQELLSDPQKNKEKIIHIAHKLPTSNLSLVSAQILDNINQNPSDKSLQNLFNEVNSHESHGEKAIQDQFQKTIKEISPKLDYGRGITNFTQNRLVLGLTYIWSTLVFLGNTIQATTLAMGKDRSKNKAAIMKSLALAGVAGGLMGITGKSILSGKPPLKVAEDFLTKSLQKLTLTKEDVDTMSIQETRVTVPRLLDQSGPYISAIFSDDQIIESLTSTNTIIDGKENLTDQVASEKLNQIHKELLQKSPEKAKFFEDNFLKPAASNPKRSLLMVYFMQKSYARAGITNANSFYSKLKQKPDKYPKIDDFKALENE